MLSPASPPLRPAAVRDLVRIAISALFLWVPLAIRNGGELWHALSRDASAWQRLSRVIAVLASGGAGVGGPIGDLCRRLQPTAVVALHSLCSGMPAAAGSASAIDATTPTGAPHPHTHILQLLLSRRARLEDAGPLAASVFYGFVEVLLRGSTVGMFEAGATPGHSRQLPPALRRVFLDIIADVQVRGLTGKPYV